MAELRLDVLRVGPVGDQQAGVGVAEIVKADAAQLGLASLRKVMSDPGEREPGEAGADDQG